jgi:hypothetical protein
MLPDLTRGRNHLAHLARMAVKKKLATKTWIYDGTVFLQIDKECKPRRIICQKDIPTEKNPPKK